MPIKEVPIVEKRKLVASGASVMLVVPKQWLEENSLDKGDEVLMVANGDLTFKKMTKENVDKIRNQLSGANIITRSDDERTGEKRQALVSPTNTKTSDSK